MGWLLGFKLHSIANGKGEILNSMFTPGDADDQNPLRQGKFLESIKREPSAGKLSPGERALIETVNDGQIAIF